MQICLLTPTFLPRKGGLETHVEALASELATLGEDVVVVTNRDSWDQPPLELANGYRIFRVSHFLANFNDPDKVPWEEAMFGVLKELEWILSILKIQIIHAHTQAALLISSFLDSSIPLVVSFHETEPQRDPFGVFRSRRLIGVPSYRFVIAGSQYFVDQALSFGAPPSSVRLVYFGLSNYGSSWRRKAAVEFLKVQFGVPDNCPLVLMVGRFKPRKGHRYLLEAFEILAKTCSAHLLMVGSCSSGSREYFDQINNDVSYYNLTGVVSIVENGSDRLAEAAREACVLLTMPSVVEGFGFAALEAMLASRPVVAADAPGLREIVVHNETGVLVNVTTASDYSAALEDLIKNHVKAGNLGRQGLERAQIHFSRERMAQQTLEVYWEALEQSVR